MTWIDFLVIAVLLVSVAWGAWRGLVHEVLSLATWVLAFLGANLLAAPLVFIAALIAGTIASALVTKVVKVSVLHGLDRWLGALFGLARGVVILVALTMVAGLTPLPRSADWKNSATGYSLAQTVIQLKPWLPKAFADRLKYN
jgi:membrane protein required for colicin V production